jgi:ubiquinone/menaquinone biosynthesis C-methylase UbiE
MYKFENIARFYDLFSTGLNADTKFYLEEAKKCGGRVLEVAVGTGRITLPLLKAGVDLYGFDISVEMIKVLEEKARNNKIDIKGRIRKADMRTFKYDGKFDLIIIPYRAFLHNLTTDDQAATMKQCCRHLKKGGRLILNFFFPNPFHLIRGINKAFKDTDITVRVKDRSVRLIGYASHDLIRQQIHIDYLFKEKYKDQKFREYRDKFSLCWIGINEFRHLAARSGFKVKELYGDFHRGKKIKLKKGELVWVLEK